MFDYQSKTLVQPPPTTTIIAQQKHPLTPQVPTTEQEDFSLEEGEPEGGLEGGLEGGSEGAASHYFPVNHYLQPQNLASQHHPKITDSHFISTGATTKSTGNPSFLMTQSHMFRQIQKGNPSLIDILHKYYPPSSDDDSDPEPQNEKDIKGRIDIFRLYK